RDRHAADAVHRGNPGADRLDAATGRTVAVDVVVEKGQARSFLKNEPKTFITCNLASNIVTVWNSAKSFLLLFLHKKKIFFPTCPISTAHIASTWMWLP